jgi:hypothetical protein
LSTGHISTGFPNKYCLGTEYIPVKRRQKSAPLGGIFSVVPTPPFRAPLPPPSRGTRPPSLRAPGRITLNCRASSPVLKTAPHVSFCSMKAQTGSLRNLVASRVLFKGRVRPLSVEDGSPQLSQFYPAQRLVVLALSLALTRIYHLAVAYICNFINSTKSLSSKPVIPREPNFPRNTVSSLSTER